MVISILPSDKDEETPILSYATIQSYGTTGGGTEIPDPTHTDVPTGQESKKTSVMIYGSGLKKNDTVIRIMDENGVIWTPVHHPSSDSADNFNDSL